MLTQLQTILLAALLVVLMAGMGASLTLEDFREVLRRPRGPLIEQGTQLVRGLFAALWGDEAAAGPQSL